MSVLTGTRLWGARTTRGEYVVGIHCSVRRLLTANRLTVLSYSDDWRFHEMRVDLRGGEKGGVVPRV